MEYNVDYFIKKMKRIPERRWTSGALIESRFFGLFKSYCANGHCGVTKEISQHETNWFINKESIAFQRLFSILKVTEASSGNSVVDLLPDYSNIAAYINNGEALEYQQPTPKQRILAALYDIKKMQEPVKQETTVIYKVVEVDKKVKALTKQEIILS